MADALGLRHRMPRLWQRVCGGHLKPWIARQIVRTSRPLTRHAAAIVDAKVADLAGTVPLGRLIKIVAAQVMRADPDDGGPPGQTRPDNLARISRREHRIKTFGRWKVIQPRSGCWVWASPHDHTYLVDDHGTHPLGKLSVGSGGVRRLA